MSFDFQKDPFENLDLQLLRAKSAEAKAAGVREPTAAILSTASKDGLPSGRTVLFKGLIRQGLSFYTNYDSKKAKQLSDNPRASLLFYWAPLFEQVKVFGNVEKLTRQESETYFASRPRLSQIGAWASQQSQKIESLEALESRVKEVESKFANKEIPCPPNWGGYRLIPLEFEFWFGRDGRLHERYVYQRPDANSKWQKFLRSP